MLRNLLNKPLISLHSKDIRKIRFNFMKCEIKFELYSYLNKFIKKLILNSNPINVTHVTT